MNDTQKPRGRRFSIIGSIALITIIALVGGSVLFGFNPMLNHDNWPTQFQSNGERIYFTATSASISPISSQGGGMHMSMMQGGCADCHGADRSGRRLMPRFWKIAPALTPAALFREHTEGGDKDGHGDHEGYTKETLSRAITRGIDAGGKKLDPAMPRWTISAQDLDDLIAYLKSPTGKPH